jgi:hypothetical protein
VLKLPRRLLQPSGYQLEYPFSVLDQQQKAFLRALPREEVQTIGQAFRRAYIERIEGHAALERWLDDVAFEEALFITLRSIRGVRQEQALDVICAFLRRQPLRRICDIPNRPQRTLTGWHLRSLNISRPPRVKRRSNIFSESGADPWK